MYTAVAGVRFTVVPGRGESAESSRYPRPPALRPDPYHRIDVRRLRACRGPLPRRHIAESSRPRLLFETSLPVRYYLPPEDVRTEHLQRSDTVTPSPYKGPGQHWYLTVTGHRVDDAAWSLP